MTTRAETIFDAVWKAYQVRACFVCGAFGWCKHREFEVEEAYAQSPKERNQ